MAALSIQTRHLDGCVVVAFDGRIDTEAAPLVRAAVHDLYHRYDRDQITLDWTAVTDLDGAGLSAVRDAMRGLAGPGRPRLVGPPPAVTEELAALVDLVDLVDVAGTYEEILPISS